VGVHVHQGLLQSTVLKSTVCGCCTVVSEIVITAPSGQDVPGGSVGVHVHQGAYTPLVLVALLEQVLEAVTMRPSG